MRVEVDGQPDLFLQRLDEDPRRRGFQKARHVLQAEDMTPRLFYLLSERKIVVEGVFRSVRIKDVTGVADGALGKLACIPNRVDRDAHVLDPVQAVEDPKNIDAGICRLPN